MKNYINGIKQGLGIISAFLVVGIIYATYTWNDMSTFNTSSGTVLSSDTWNKLITNINYLKQEVDTLKSSGGGSMFVKEIMVGGTNSASATTICLTSPQTQIDFTGLDGNRDGGYEVEYNIIAPNQANYFYSIKLNNTGNYTTRFAQEYMGTVDGGIKNFLYIGNSSAANKYINGSVLFQRAIGGEWRFRGSYTADYTWDGRIVLNNWFGGKSDITGNISSLTLLSDTVSTISDGSVFRLYKRK